MIPFVPLQYQFLAKFVLILATAGLGGFAGWYVTSDHYLAEINALKVANSNAVNAELMRQQKLAGIRAEKSRLAEEQHAKDQLVISRLGNELGRVRVHLSAIGCGALPGAGQGATDSNGTGRMAAARADEYLEQARRAIQDIGQRCAQLNIDAIASNSRTKNGDATDSVNKTGD